MIQNLYSVRDAAGNLWTPPFMCRNDAEATREFQVGCERENSRWAKWPEDYSLWLIGQFDETTGEIAATQMEKICGAESFVSRSSGPKDDMIRPLSEAM